MFEMVWVWPVRAICFTCALPRTECIPYPRSIFDYIYINIYIHIYLRACVGVCVCCSQTLSQALQTNSCGPNVLLSIVFTRGRAAGVLILCPHGGGEYFKELKNMAESGHEMPIFHHIPRWRSPIYFTQAAELQIRASFERAIKLSSSHQAVIP